MKQLKRALLSTAVLAGLAAGNAHAGTEACFEVTRATDAGTAATVLARWATVYQTASCDNTAGAASAKLLPFDPIKVAYELTGDLPLSLNDIDGNNTADDVSLAFYVPTTDLPGGSRITMNLAGATFAGNGNQLHLIRATTTDNVNYTLESVASSDGVVDTTGAVTFVTKAANTVTAGSRLFISRTNVFANPVVAANYAALNSMGLKLANSGCPATPDVKLTATSAVTDGGSAIAGGRSGTDAGANGRGSVLTLVQATPQFKLFTTGTQAGATAADVNAEVPSLRTEFVYANNAGVWTPTRVRPDFAWFEANFTSATGLDRSLALQAGDRVVIHAAATGSTGAGVRFDAKQAIVDATGETLAEVFNDPAGDLPWSTTFAGALTTDALTLPEFADPASAPARFLNANSVFIAGTEAQTVAAANNNRLFFTLENNNDEVMNFNYEVNVRYGIEFAAASRIDLAPSCNSPVNTHDVGVNGAVLKVPYTVDATGNFVRISNEHTEAAEITMDVFGENLAAGSAGKETVGVAVGTVPAKSSVLLLVSDLITKAKAAGYTGDVAAANTNGKRHFMTFTVTAPKNKVHGVSVQKITGGSDRVIPVLDQNDWNQ